MAKEDITQRTIKGIIRRIRSNSSITDYNKKLVTEDLIEWLKAAGGNSGNGSDPKTIAKYLYSMERMLSFLPKHVDFNKITKQQMLKAIAALNSSNYADWTKSMVRTVLKTFYRHFYGDDIMLPPVVGFIKSTRPRNQINGADLLSEQEVLMVIKKLRNPRDQSAIAVMYDLALRSGEMQIKVRDVNLSEGYVFIDGKTGRRKAWLSSFGIPFLSAYLNSVPDKKPDDWLWSDYRGEMLTAAALRMAFKRACKEAKLEKPRIWLYMLRHSRVTSWINRGVPMSAIKKQIGHTPGSTIAESTYSHLVDADVKEHILAAAGDQVKTEPEPIVLKGWTCGYCNRLNGATAKYCSGCGRPRDIGIALQSEKLQEAAIKSVIDSKYIDELVSKYVEEKLKGKKGKN